MLAAGTAISGQTGAIAMKSTDTGGTLRYLPSVTYQTSISDGKAAPDLVNNAAFAVNDVQGAGIGQVGINTLLFAGLLNADFFTRILGNFPDTGISGYHTMTLFPDDAGAGDTQIMGLCKLDTFTLDLQFSTDGAVSAAQIGMSFISVDPESGTVTALTTPSAGPLTTANILGYAQTAITGASQMARLQLALQMRTQPVPGNVAGGNADYPILAPQLIRTGLMGTVRVTQIRRPTTRFKGGNLSFAIGSTGAGVNFAMQTSRRVSTKSVRTGINYETTTAALKSSDGTIPIVCTDL